MSHIITVESSDIPTIIFPLVSISTIPNWSLCRNSRFLLLTSQTSRSPLYRPARTISELSLQNFTSDMSSSHVNTTLGATDLSNHFLLTWDCQACLSFLFFKDVSTNQARSLQDN